MLAEASSIGLGDFLRLTFMLPLAQISVFTYFDVKNKFFRSHFSVVVGLTGRQRSTSGAGREWVGPNLPWGLPKQTAAS